MWGGIHCVSLLPTLTALMLPIDPLAVSFPLPLNHHGLNWWLRPAVYTHTLQLEGKGWLLNGHWEERAESEQRENTARHVTDTKELMLGRHPAWPTVLRGPGKAAPTFKFDSNKVHVFSQSQMWEEGSLCVQGAGSWIVFRIVQGANAGQTMFSWGL